MADELEANMAPRTGCAILAVPIVIAAVLIGGYGIFFVASVRGRPADGEVVRMAFTGCDDAQYLVKDRVGAMGLGDPYVEDTPEGFTVTARLPAEADVAARIPATLAAPGHLAIRGGPLVTDPVLATEGDLVEAVFRLDFTVSPRVGITLDPDVAARVAAWSEAHLDQTTTVWIDGVRAAERLNEPGIGWDRLDLGPSGENADVVHTVAAWALVLQHGPLPCDLTVAQTAPSP